jgi:hypothetical protein
LFLDFGGDPFHRVGSPRLTSLDSYDMAVQQVLILKNNFAPLALVDSMMPVQMGPRRS